MTRPRFDFTISVGTILTSLVLLVAFLGWFYAYGRTQQQRDDQIHLLSKGLATSLKQTSRIEQYLASKDATYWKTVADFPVADPPILMERTSQERQGGQAKAEATRKRSTNKQ